MLTNIEIRLKQNFNFILTISYVDWAVAVRKLEKETKIILYIRCGRVVTDFDWEAKNRFNF